MIKPEKIKILFFCGGTKVYGKEKAVFSIMKGLKERGYPIKNISNGWNDGHFNQMLSQAGIPYQETKVGRFYIPRSWKLLKWTLDSLINIPLGLLKTWKAIRLYKPSAFHFDSYIFLYYLLPILPKNSFIILGHHELPLKNFYLKKILTNTLAPNITHYGVSQFIVQKLLSLDVPKDQVLLVYNGVIDKGSIERKIITSNNIIIGCAGQIAPKKGQEVLLEAIQFVAKEEPYIRCWIAGNGEIDYVNFLQDRASTMGILELIEWKGYLQNMTMFYDNVDICIIPSIIEESFGLIPVEAGLFEVPSIVTSQGGLKEIVQDEKTGFVVPVNDARAIANKILFFINNPEQIKKMGSQARKNYLNRFSQKQQVDGIELIIKKHFL